MERVQELLMGKELFERALATEEASLAKFIETMNHERFSEWPENVQAKHRECIATLQEEIPKARKRVEWVTRELEAMQGEAQ